MEGWWRAPRLRFGRGKCFNRAVEAVNRYTPLPLAPSPEGAGVAVSKFLKLNRCGLGVVLTTFRDLMLVIPDVLRRAGSVEKEDVRRDRCVGSEDTVREMHDRMEVELREKLLLDSRSSLTSATRINRAISNTPP